MALKLMKRVAGPVGGDNHVLLSYNTCDKNTGPAEPTRSDQQGFFFLEVCDNLKAYVTQSFYCH